MRLPPLEVISTWPTPNYEHPSSLRGNQLLVITCIFFPIALLMVAARMYTRIRISRSFGIDDVFLLLALPPAFGVATLLSLAVTRWGWDRHIWDVPINHITLGLKLTMIVECLFALSVSCCKISLLILTRRVTSSSTGLLKHLATAAMVFVVCKCTAFIFAVVFTCTPIKDYWTLSVTDQHCIDESANLLAGGILNTVSDFIVFFLPIPTVLALQLPFRQRMMLCGIFGAGFAVCIAGCFRIYYAYKTTSTFDRTWVSYGLWVSGVLELYIGIMCTALPVCKPFFSRFVPFLLGTTFGSSDVSKSYGSGYNNSRNDGRNEKGGDIELRAQPVVASPPRATLRGAKLSNKEVPFGYPKHSRQHSRPPMGRLEAELDRSSSESSEHGIEVTREVMQTSEPVTPLHSDSIGHRLERAESRDKLIKRDMF